MRTIHDMPRSCGVTVPSVSCPMIGKPFSARSTCIASVPYGVMPNGSPAAITASHIARPCQPATFSSYASSPLKLTRAIRVGMPATVPSRNVMNGNASADRSTSVPSAASTSRARGPFIAIVDHCSVTLVQYTRRSGHSVCSHSSKCSSTFAAPPVVVVTKNRSSSRRITTPSSNAMPSTPHIRP